MSKTLIKQKLREINQLAGYDLHHPPNMSLAHERIRVYARFARACGAKGLVVLFDEVERLAKFTRRQRLAAYGELGWWKQAAAEEGAHILPVFAANAVQVDEAVQKDLPFLTYPTLPGGLFQEVSTEAPTEGIKMLRDECKIIRNILPEEREQLKYRVKDLYKRAYAYEPPEPPAADVATTVRSDIRRWITYWDLHRYYPAHQAAIDTTEMELDETEIADTVLPRDPDTES